MENTEMDLKLPRFLFVQHPHLTDLVLHTQEPPCLVHCIYTEGMHDSVTGVYVEVLQRYDGIAVNIPLPNDLAWQVSEWYAAEKKLW